MFALVFSAVCCRGLRGQANDPPHPSAPTPAGTGSKLADPAISARGKQATDTADGGSNYELMLGEDPHNRLGYPLIRHFAADQRAFWMAPAQYRVQDLEWITPFAAPPAAFKESDS